MPTSWLSWRRSLACKSQPGEVHDPQSLAESSAKVEAVFVNRRLYRSGCSRSIANLRDVIHSSRRIDSGRAAAAIPNFSPKSVESNDFIQSISHEAMLRDHECDHHHHHRYHHNHYQRRQHPHGKLSLDDIVADHHPHPYHHHHYNCNGSVLKSSNNANVGSFYGTPLHHSARATPLHHSASKGISLKKFSGCYDCKNPAVSLVVYTTSSGSGGSGGGSSLPPVARPVCQRCGEAFPKYEALEQHHLLKHAVTELEVGDSSRNVVEIIFRTSWLRGSAAAAAAAASVAPPAGGGLRIERVLKVNNLARTLARFEDYREGVKTRASKLPKKHPRCLADGNELLRFYGATLECGLLTARDAAVQARAGGAAACHSASCAVCKIIRTGFPKMRGPDGGKKGILTTATSGRAHQILSADDQLQEKENDRDSDHDGARSSDGGLMAMLVCRVIAGRVHKPPSTPPHSGDLGPPSAGFDSVAGGEAGVGAAPTAAGLHSRFEELTVFSPRAILPCFVVLYRC